MASSKLSKYGDSGNIYKCLKCGFTTHESPNIWRCPKCGYLIDLIYSYKNTLPDPRDIVKCISGIWCFRDQLPGYRVKYSLGEGFTKYRVLNIDGLKIIAKLELYNPTGSFKDRGTAIAISMVRSLGSGISNIVEDSSGNAGLSTSCYSTYAGIKPVIVVPKTAPSGKIHAIELCGGRIIFADNRDRASEIAADLGEREGYVYLPHTWLPHFVIGMKTIAYELYLNLGDDVTHIFIPSSSGSALIGIYKGYIDLYRWGYVKTLPKLIAVQNTYAYPLYKELKNNQPEIVEEHTLADGISLRNPPRLYEMRNVIENTGGDVVVVSNKEIKESVKNLIKLGVIAEPTSASALAALLKYRDYIEIPENPVILLTGTGIKMISLLKEIAG